MLNVQIGKCYNTIRIRIYSSVHLILDSFSLNNIQLYMHIVTRYLLYHWRGKEGIIKKLPLLSFLTGCSCGWIGNSS